jgi:hypothetical protein
MPVLLSQETTCLPSFAALQPDHHRHAFVHARYIFPQLKHSAATLASIPIIATMTGKFALA